MPLSPVRKAANLLIDGIRTERREGFAANPSSVSAPFTMRLKHRCVRCADRGGRRRALTMASAKPGPRGFQDTVKTVFKRATPVECCRAMSFPPTRSSSALQRADLRVSSAGARSWPPGPSPREAGVQRAAGVEEQRRILRCASPPPSRHRPEWTRVGGVSSASKRLPRYARSRRTTARSPPFGRPQARPRRPGPFRSARQPGRARSRTD